MSEILTSNIIEETYIDANEFFNAIGLYFKSIDCTTMRADRIPYIGVIMYRVENNHEEGKYFLISCNDMKKTYPNLNKGIGWVMDKIMNIETDSEV